MPERWTPKELEKFKQVIKLAPKSRAMEKAGCKRKLDKLMNKLHGQDEAPERR